MTDSPSSLLAQAVDLHRRGAVAEAERLYWQVLQAEPAHAQALHYLGMARCQQGKFAEAIELLDRALASAPQNAATHNLRGMALARLARFEAAVESFDRAIGHQPDLAQAHGNRANALCGMRRLAEAIESYDRALSLQPDSAEDWCNRGSALCELGRFAEAIQSFESAIGLTPHFPAALVNCGTALCKLDRFTEAIARFDAALALAPQLTEALVGRGLALRALGRQQEAIASFTRALNASAAGGEIYFNRGLAQLDLGQNGQALADFERALKINPGSAEGWRAAASTLALLGRFDEAVAAVDRAITLDPESAVAHLIRGVSLYNLLRDIEALKSLDRSLAIDPRNGRAYSERAMIQAALGRQQEALADVDLAVAHGPDDRLVLGTAGDLLLLYGRWREGWKHYEHRFAIEEGGLLHARAASTPAAVEPAARVRQFASPLPYLRWRGEAPDGFLLLLVAEQGLGDTIQFARFAPVLAGRGHRVAILTTPVLAPLMTSLLGVEMIIADPARLDRYGAIRWLPMLSLPTVLGLTVETIPAGGPYLTADPDRVGRWRARLGSQGLRVGIGWQGNPNFRFDKGRSIPLRDFAPLAAVSEVRLVSLQRGPGAEQIAQVAFGDRIEVVLEAGDSSADALLESAALVTSLDLVVTSDSMLAHLAGALGRPVMVALRHRMTDWRWLTERSDSPWYPTMQLFRQTREGDWAEVFGRIASAIGQRIKR